MSEKTKETMRLLGHDFEHDRPALDFYETPAQAVIGLLQKEYFEGTCWDPASGNGAITKFFPNMFASDIRTDDQVVGEKGVDFLKQERFVQNIIVNPPINPKGLREFDALGDWQGRRIFCNPPYSNPKPWIRKAIEEKNRGKIVVMLLKCDTSTGWFHDLIVPNAEIRFVRGRLKFGKGTRPSPFPSLVAIFR